MGVVTQRFKELAEGLGIKPAEVVAFMELL